MDDLIQAFKTVTKGLTMDTDQTFMWEVWLEKLIKVAEMEYITLTHESLWSPRDSTGTG